MNYEIIRGIPYCSDECRHLEWDAADGWCYYLKKSLTFYDGFFVAECDSPFAEKYRREAEYAKYDEYE